MMKHIRKIKPPFWMKLKETKEIMKSLNERSKEPVALFVGGCVRNALMGIEDEYQDIDIATKLTPDTVMEKLMAKKIRVIPTGLDHGTVTAVRGGYSYEITTLRKDLKTDGRHAVVEFSNDWIEDAKRRDFTMNTLLADMKGKIYDPLGTGLDDLDERKVLFVGDPEERIREDYLRILRFFRFHTLYGTVPPDEKAIEACKNGAPKIAMLSKERITLELFKILNSENPRSALEKMERIKILDCILPDEFSMETLDRLCQIQKKEKFSSIAPRLLVLINMDVRNIPALETCLVLSNAIKKEITYLAEALNEMSEKRFSSDMEMVYFFGKSIAVQTLIIEKATKNTESVSMLNERILNIKDMIIPVLPIDGNDVQEMGIESGPKTGKVLRKTEKWWIEKGFKPYRDECLKAARQIAGGLPK